MTADKPLQRLSWAEKTKNNYEYFKRTAQYYIAQSSFAGSGNSTTNRKEKMQTMYNVYNSQIPMDWFAHFTNPLAASDPRHKKFPAKIRPTNILRTNLDLLMSEYKHRPFKYRVENIGESGYNQFLESMNGAIHQNLQQIFTAAFQQEQLAQGADPEEVQAIPLEQIPFPEEVKKTFQTSYKDKQAIKGQKWMKRAMLEYKFRQKFLKMFKDWILAGEAISYKDVRHGDLVYERLSPLYVDYDKSPDSDLIEDGEWVVILRYMTLSDIVDILYDQMTESDHKALEAKYGVPSSPSMLFNRLESLKNSDADGKIAVHQAIWKGRKQIGTIETQDPTTGRMEEEQIAEEEFHLLPPDMKVNKMWVNEVYQTWVIGTDKDALYFNMEPITCQRNALNNYSTCKLPVNGRKFSDTHAENISVAQLGMPYLIMYIIVTRTLELTIARSKGKILLIDKNVIPNKNGWNEEKFFYYSEAMGYGLLDRNQVGVDKSYNQYQVVDLSLYENIKQLIELQMHFKQEWDDILGITRQRKGQTFATDTMGANNQALFQSTMITEMIYAGFEEFIMSELQGLIDLSKFVNINGLRRLYNGTDLDDILLEIDPVAYCNADLGIFATVTNEDYMPLEMLKAQAQNLIQNQISPSTLLDIFAADNVAELKANLKKVEQATAEANQAAAANEQEAQQALEQSKMEFMEYEKMLEEMLINAEYDRKEDIEHIKGQYASLSYQAPEDADGDGVPDVNELMKREIDREKIVSAERMQQREIGAKERMEKMKAVIAAAQKEKESQRKMEIEKYKADKQAAAAKAKARTKTK